MRHLFFSVFFMLALVFSMQAQRVKDRFPVDYLRQEPSKTLTIPKDNENKLKYFGNDLYSYSTVELDYQRYAKVPNYAEMSISNDTSIITWASGTTAAVIQDLTAGPLRGFTLVSDSLLKYTGKASGVFRISYNASFSFTEASNIINGFVQVNGSEATRSRFRQTITTASTERENVAGSCIVTLAPNALVRFMFQPSTHTGSDDLNVYQFNLNIVQLE